MRLPVANPSWSENNPSLPPPHPGAGPTSSECDRPDPRWPMGCRRPDHSPAAHHDPNVANGNISEFGRLATPYPISRKKSGRGGSHARNTCAPENDQVPQHAEFRFSRVLARQFGSFLELIGFAENKSKFGKVRYDNDEHYALDLEERGKRPRCSASRRPQVTGDFRQPADLPCRFLVHMQPHRRSQHDAARERSW